jgi:hypothetical protein
MEDNSKKEQPRSEAGQEIEILAMTELEKIFGGVMGDDPDAGTRTT